MIRLERGIETAPYPATQNVKCLPVLITELPEAPLPTKWNSFLMHIQPATFQTRREANAGLFELLLSQSYYYHCLIFILSSFHIGLCSLPGLFIRVIRREQTFPKKKREKERPIKGKYIINLSSNSLRLCEKKEKRSLDKTSVSMCVWVH